MNRRQDAWKARPLMVDAGPGRRLTLGAMALTGLLLGGCASAPPRASVSGAPVNAQVGCHAPAPNLRAAYNRTYTVRGRSYTPLQSASGYDEVGTASWYGWESGTTTSMGTRFSPRDFSAASRVLPLPTCVQVTNLDNGLSALVLVNDRGPFVSGRLLDLSMGAAQALGVTRTGTARVRIVALPEGADAPLQYAQATSAPSAQRADRARAADPETSPPQASPAFAPQQFAAAPVGSTSASTTSELTGSVPQQAVAPTPIEEQVLPPLAPPSAPVVSASRAGPAAATTLQSSLPQPALSLPDPPQEGPSSAGVASPTPQNYVQTGAFTLQANADAEKARLQAAGVGGVMVVPGYIRGQTFYRVQIGPISGPAPDAALTQALRGLGLTAFSVVQQ